MQEHKSNGKPRQRPVPRPLRQAIEKYVSEAADTMDAVAAVRGLLHGLSPCTSQPVDYVRWVPIDMVEANNYNPNAVAGKEMQLLFISIDHDGYTQPIVTIWDAEKKKYVIVDGFHRYYVMWTYPEIKEKTGGLLPIVVIDKAINDRMASTVRHNRARGKHSINGMASMVFKMLENGWEDSAICNELGMEAEELLRLKHITGFSRLFENVEYRKAWVTKRQIKLAKDHGQPVL